MTPGFEYPQGLAVLLIIPLFLLLHRRRARPKPVTLTLYPLLRNLITRHEPPPALFRPRRRTRVVIVSIAVLCLSMVLSGFSLSVDKRRPVPWLIVVDNSTGIAEEIADGRAWKSLQEMAEGIAAGAGKDDPIAVVTLWPTPAISTRVPATNLRETLEHITPSPHRQDVRWGLRLVEQILGERRFTRTVILSPRAGEWDQAVRFRGLQGLVHVPEIRQTLKGNFGIVAFDLRPSISRADRYDLFFSVAGQGTGSDIVRADLLSGGSTVRQYDLPMDGEGSAAVTEAGLELSPGPLKLTLLVDDQLRADDTVTAEIRQSSLVRVRMTGIEDPFLKSAINAYQGFSLVTSDSARSEAQVDVIRGGPDLDRLERPTLIVDPRGEFLSFGYTGIQENPGEAVFEPVHPVTRHVAFRNFRPARLFGLKPPDGVQVLGRAGTAPVILAGIVDGFKTVVWAFDPLENSIALDPSFVVLLRASLEWISESQPVRWSVSRVCEPEQSPESPGSHNGSGAGLQGNVLCETVTLEASSITLQAPEFSWDSALTASTPARFDLAPWLLIPVVLILLYLLTVDVLTGSRGKT